MRFPISKFGHLYLNIKSIFMVEIRPFAAVRYATKFKHILGSFISPPYDIISPDGQNVLYQRHPYNFVRIELPRTSTLTPGYRTSLRNLTLWQKKKIFQPDPKPGIYIHQHRFSLPGKNNLVRTGFFALLRLSPWGESVFPHEKTLSAPKRDRTLTLQTTKTNTSPIMALYPDPTGKTINVLHHITNQTSPTVNFVYVPPEGDDKHENHKLWYLSDPELYTKLVTDLQKKPVFIADGHHRFETAYEYAQQVHRTVNKPGVLPEDYVLTYFCAFEDTGLVILPTHRLVVLDEIKFWIEWLTRNRTLFTLIECKSKRDMLNKLTSKDKLCGVYVQHKFYVLQINRIKVRWWLTENVPDYKRKQAYFDLGISILHDLVLNNLPVKQVSYVKSIDECIGITSANPTSTLTFILKPTELTQIQKISLSGLTMPPKSTYFYPKVPAGMVMYAHQG